jgi:predicted dehydrogenase
LDSIHEIDYRSWLLGPVIAVTADSGNIGDLDIDVEDYAAMSMRHMGGARSEVHMDYLQRFKRRGCEIVGSQGTLLWESFGKRPEHCVVRLFDVESGSWETLLEDSDVDPNAAYERLLNNFVSALNGGENDLHTGAEALHALKVACAVRSVSESGQGRASIDFGKLSYGQ